MIQDKKNGSDGIRVIQKKMAVLKSMVAGAGDLVYGSQAAALALASIIIAIRILLFMWLRFFTLYYILVSSKRITQFRL
jgi:hypothetical protein